MLEYRQRPTRPWWVQLGLAGLPNRGSAVAFLWLSILLTVAAAVAGFFFPWAWLGVLFVWSALWYWACIRWVDRNDQWS
jgi:hypothetical protein